MVDHDSIPSRKWTSKLPVSHRIGHSVLAVDNEATDDVADIYNQAGDDYVSYADGDPSRPFAFDGMHAYADRCVWAVLESKLTDLRASGASSVRLLDAGCGPGTWLRRLVIRAHALGFSSISARGFDIAEAQLQRARLASRNLANLPGVDLTFDVADLMDRLPEPDASVDLTLCLYSALSHLPVASLTDISTEIARVTSGYFTTTVRPIGSTPTAFIDSNEKVRRLRQDHARDRCELDLSDGRRIAFSFTSLERSNCETISPVISTSKICEVSTCFTVDSRQILGGTRYHRQAIVNSPMSSSGSRGRMPQAWSSWIAPSIYCSWRAVGDPLRLQPVSWGPLNTGDFCLNPYS